MALFNNGLSPLISGIHGRHNPGRGFSTNIVLNPSTLVGKFNAVEAHAELRGEVRTTSRADLDRFTTWLCRAVRRVRVEGVTLGLVILEDQVPPDKRGASDLNSLVDLIPLLDGLGAVGMGWHTEEEWIDQDTLGKRTALLFELVQAIKERA